MPATEAPWQTLKVRDAGVNTDLPMGGNDIISGRLDRGSTLCSLRCSSYVVPRHSHRHTAARLLTGTRRGEHISPVLCQLHWLPVQRRIDFKLACFVFSSLSGQAPSYLADDIHLVSEGPRRWLRSSTDRLCGIPCTHNTFSDRSFAVAGPRVWNSLPANLRDEDITYTSFRGELKTY